MSRIAIHHPKDHTRPTMIAAERYDPDLHELWDPEAAQPDAAPAFVPEPAEPDDILLPDGFPHREFVIGAGIRTIHEARAVPDWDQYEGIGQAREADIVAYLADLEEHD